MDITLEESNTDNVTPLLYEITKNILLESRSVDTIQKDILFVLCVLLMLENGFSLVNSDLETIKPIQFFNSEQLHSWKTSTGVYEALLIMPGFQKVMVKLIMSPLGATVLVNLVIIELNCETYSVCVPVSRYVVSPRATTIPLIFRDLKHFSIMLKNTVVSPVKSKINNYHGYASASLMGLPEEVLFRILIYLPIEDVLSVCKTCNRLNALLQNESLWHTLCKRDFHNDSETDVQSWRELYKQMYVLEQDTKNKSMGQAAGTMHDYMDYSDYVSYIDNPMWNII